MEPNLDLNPDTDDLPLRANTNHILIRHYVLDLAVHFHSKVMNGSAVLFLEPCPGVRGTAETDNDPVTSAGIETVEGGGSQDCSGFEKNEAKMDFGSKERDKAKLAAARESWNVVDTEIIQSSDLWQTTSEDDFTLVLDCCDLDVSKVEEVDITSASAMLGPLPEVPTQRPEVVSVNPQAVFIQKLFSLPSTQWRLKHQFFSLCGHAPGAQNGSSLQFYRDLWSLQVRKKGVTSPQEFPRVIRICYKTRPSGGSVRWTKDQDNRFVSRCM